MVKVKETAVLVTEAKAEIEVLVERWWRIIPQMPSLLSQS